MKPNNRILTALLASLALASSAHAASILSDDFEGYSAGSNLGAASDWNTRLRGLASDASYTISNTNDFGASNQFLEIVDGPDAFASAVHTTVIPANQAVTFSTHFIAANDQNFRFGFSSGTDEGTTLGSDIVARVSFTNGEITSDNSTAGYGTGFFTLNIAYEFKMVLNDSGASINYADRSLADNSFDVWIRDLNDSGSTYVGTSSFTSAAQYHSAVRSFNAPAPTVYIDNWSVDEGAIVTPIPEPSSLGLLGLALGGLLLRRRRA